MLTYICDQDGKLRDLAQSFYPGAIFTTDMQVVLSDPEVAAVVVAVNAPYHFEVGKLCLEAGKHVFIEKINIFFIRNTISNSYFFT